MDVAHAGLLLALSRRYGHRAPVLDDIAAFVAARRDEAARPVAAA